MKRICVFCGSGEGRSAAYREAAASLGALLAERRLGLVYGAGCTGMMGALAEAALAGGAEVIGVVPQALNTERWVHAALSRLIVVDSLHARKALMNQLGDAFIALPGGYGTFDELLEATTLAQLGFHHKPVGLLNVAGYFDPLLEQLDRAVCEGFVPSEQRSLLLAASTGAELLDQLSRRADTTGS